MNEIQTIEIKQIEVEINFYKEQTARNIIEIGKRLAKAKEIVPYGKWGKWIDQKVDFSYETANKYIRYASEFSHLSVPTELGKGQMDELLSLPTEEREDFIESNPVENMTTRELRQAIKEKKELEKELEETKLKHNDLVDKNLRLQGKEPEVVEVEVPVEVVPDDYNYYKESTERLYEVEREMLNLEVNLKDKENSKKENERLRKELTSKSEEIFDLKKEIELMAVTDSKEEHIRKLKDTALTFSARVHDFINSVGGLAWLTDYFDELGDYEKSEYLKAIKLLDGWIETVKANINKEEL